MAAKILQRVESSLRSFYIFNSDYCRAEGEEYKKVLYYYPDNIELNAKIKDVGLSEAIIEFTSTFTNTKDDCKALHTQKTTQLFYQPEPGYWLVLVVNLPKEIRSKDGVEVTDYRGNEVHDCIYRNLLKQFYNMFRLLEGSFEMQISNITDAEECRQCLVKNLKRCFDQVNQYVQFSLLKIPVNDVIELTHSIPYLPLDKMLYLRAHNLTNTLCATFPIIKDISFFYKEQIVYSGKLSPQDLFSLHAFIADLSYENTTHDDGIPTSTQTNRSGGFFIAGDPKSSPSPVIYLLNENGDLARYHLAVYRTLNVTLCLKLGIAIEESEDFCADFQLNVGAHLNSLSSDISDMVNQKYAANMKTLSTPTTSSTSLLHDALSDANIRTPKYIFINQKSLKNLSNITAAEHRQRRFQVSSKAQAAGGLPANVLYHIANLIGEEHALNSVKTNLASAAEETQLKTTNDYWIVRRCCNWRQYYVIILNGKATLLDITQESKRLFDNELSNLVFFDY